MLHPKCDVCGQPAMIHETTLEGGKAVTRHLCPEHGPATLPGVNLGPEAFQAAQERFQSLSDAELQDLALLYRLTHRGT
jgi:hypothetical protein